MGVAGHQEVQAKVLVELLVPVRLAGLEELVFGLVYGCLWCFVFQVSEFAPGCCM